MFKTLVKDGRDIVLGILQDFFQNDPNVQAGLRWDPELALTKIWISDRSPDSMRFFPAIVSRCGAGRNMKTGFRHFAEMVSANGEEYRRYSGKWHIPFYFIIASQSTLERDQICDHVINCFEVFSYEKMLCNGIEMEPDSMAVSGDETLFIDPTTPIERLTVSAMFFLEWYHDTLVAEPVVKQIVLDKNIEVKIPPVTR